MSKFLKLAQHHGLSLGLIILTTIYAFGIPSIRSLFDEGLVGTQFLPQVLVLITLVSLAFVVIRDYKTAHKLDQGEDRATDAGVFSLKQAIKPIALFIATLTYIALFKPTGFVIATFAYSFCVLSLFSHASNQLHIRALIAVAITGLAYLLFAVAFGTHLNIYPVGF